MTAPWLTIRLESTCNKLPFGEDQSVSRSIESEVTMTTVSADQFLMGGGGKSAAFPVIGTTVAGIISGDAVVQQQKDPDTGELKVWKDGNPQLHLVIPVQTQLKVDADDDGLRKFYAKGNMKAAIADAVRKSGAKGLQIGGALAVTYYGDGDKPSPTRNAPKLYTAQYMPPAPNVVPVDGGQVQQAPPQQQYQQQAPPVQQYQQPVQQQAPQQQYQQPVEQVQYQQPVQQQQVQQQAPPVQQAPPQAQAPAVNDQSAQMLRDLLAGQ